MRAMTNLDVSLPVPTSSSSVYDNSVTKLGWFGHDLQAICVQADVCMADSDVSAECIK